MTLRELRRVLDDIPSHMGDCEVRIYTSMGLAYVHKDIENVLITQAYDVTAKPVEITIQTD